MTHSEPSPIRHRWTVRQTDASRAPFLVAGFALLGALGGLAVGNVFSGWFAAAGMLALSLIYLAFGVFSLSLTRESVPRPRADTSSNDVVDPAKSAEDTAMLPEPRRKKSLRRAVASVD